MKFTNKPAQSQIATQSIAQKPEAQKAKKSRKRITNVGYDDSVFERILHFVAAGETVAEACRRPGMPHPVTLRRRLAVDDALADKFRTAEGIKLRGMVEGIQGAGARAIAEAERKGQKVSTADRVAAAKLDTDTVKWAAQKLLQEYQGFEDGGGTVTLNILNAPDALPAGAPAAPYVPAGAPVLKIVGGPKSDDSEAVHG
ncbi:hypothetical protein NE850_23105 [Paraburkholderia sp. USG1]|uniref:terminase small subunit-like protein n=1 Tax=Paraburkholderia sp. USG1 TaxID=2952268 RepID=UPI00285530A3|nr:hypothetical protein [Paraburkholderia sp. USG1]MDR8399214.1 hypothetical protein [Paraburkholderia sp. USG1]